MSALRSARLVDALGSVPREEFLGPGPWQILRLAEAVRGYELVHLDCPTNDWRRSCGGTLPDPVTMQIMRETYCY